MSYEQIVQQGVALGSGFLIDMLTFKALCAGAGKVVGLSGKIKDLATAAKVEQSAAATTSITSGSNQLAQDAATTAKLIADHGADGARKILNAVKENPWLIEAEGGFTGAAREVSTLEQMYKRVALGKGSTGRMAPMNLKEQLAMKEVLSNPLQGAKELESITMTDQRWLVQDGWVKMAKNVNDVEIHYVYNKTTGAFDDFKFKPHKK